jgi:hypothetical protein
MTYYVFYRAENSDYLKSKGYGKYTCIKTGYKSKYKKVVFKFAVKMNTHIKKFHTDRFGKDVYFVRGVA